MHISLKCMPFFTLIIRLLIFSMLQFLFIKTSLLDFNCCNSASKVGLIS